MKPISRAYRPLLVAFLFGWQTISFGAEPANSNLDTEVTTFNDWQISQSQFCPEEPVVIYARVTNKKASDLELRLVPGDNNRALVQIRDSSGAVVWDTDQLGRIEEALHTERHGIGRILAGPSIYRKVLKPNAMAFWISRWEQRDLKGEFVEHGEYFIDVSYRWQLGDDGEVRKPIHFHSARIVISIEGCE